MKGKPTMADEPKSSKDLAGEIQRMMAVFIVGGAIYALWTQKFSDLIALVPFFFYLTPAFRKLYSWANGHRCPLTMMAVILMWVPLLSLFLSQLVEKGLKDALCVTALYVLLFGALIAGIHFSFDSKLSE